MLQHRLVPPWFVLLIVRLHLTGRSPILRFLEGWIGDHSVEFLVDSGSSVTAVSNSFYQTLVRAGAPLGVLGPTARTLLTANGARIGVSGCSHCVVSFMGLQVEFPVLVCDSAHHGATSPATGWCWFASCSPLWLTGSDVSGSWHYTTTSSRGCFTTLFGLVSYPGVDSHRSYWCSGTRNWHRW